MYIDQISTLSNICFNMLANYKAIKPHATVLLVK